MQFRNQKYILVILFVLFFSNSVFAKGNLIARCEKLETQHLGIDDAGFAVSKQKYQIETGKCYKLEIASTGKHEYILRAPEFFSSIYIRKLDVANTEIGINSLRSIDFDDEVSVKLYFLVVKPGTYEIRDKYLADKGTRFEIEVE
ncbi:MAG: copper-binding protein [Proteobacteria bacterium]|nr:copper-binding protein [Pseudomonadota bacterium]